MRYLVIVEATETGFSAYASDLPGCIATCRTREIVERAMTEAIAFPLNGLTEPGIVVPAPNSSSSLVEIPEQVFNNVMKEHDRIVLTSAVPEHALEPGDVGTVVHVYPDGKAFEVEFTTLDGHTAAVATVEVSHVRPVTGGEITHARQLAAR